MVRAAGGIVHRPRPEGGYEVALVHRPNQRDWTMPKGKLEPGETLEAAALREVEEETGWQCSLGRYVGRVHYIDSRRRPKVVYYWLMERLSGEFRRTIEIDELAWLPVEEALERLSYPHDRALLRSAFPAAVAGDAPRAE